MEETLEETYREATKIMLACREGNTDCPEAQARYNACLSEYDKLCAQDVGALPARAQALKKQREMRGELEIEPQGKI